MKVTRRQIRKMLSEGFSFGGERFGFTGPGFGGSVNTYNPYLINRIQEQEELDAPEPEEDVWAGGENLAQPVEHDKLYSPDLVSEMSIRKAIKKVLGKK